LGDVRNEGLNQESGTAVYFPASRASRQKLNIFVPHERRLRAQIVKSAIKRFEAFPRLTDKVLFAVLTPLKPYSGRECKTV